MNKFFNQSNKILSLILILLFIQGCGPQTRQVTKPSVDNQKNLAYLLKQAQQAGPGQKSPLLVQAAGLLVIEERFEKAQELLIRVEQQSLTPAQMNDFRLYYGETLLALEATEASLNQLLSITQISSKPLHWQLRYSKSLANSYLAAGNYFEAAKLRIELEDIIEDASELAENNEQIWFVLNQVEADYLKQMTTDFNSHRLNGWLEIVYINKRWGFNPNQLLAEVELWKKRYPLHPSSVNQPASLQRAAQAKTYSPRKIAVLLPLSGKNAKAASLINDGIIAAHFQTMHSQSLMPQIGTLQTPQDNTPPLLSFYDTAASLTALTPYQQALNDGADFILGPLTKDSIENILNQEQLEVPLLALNRLNQQQYYHPQAFQFGLSPEDEAIQSAHRAFEKGYRKAIAFLPESSLGKRVEESFRNYFEQLGGELITVQNYKDSKSLKQNVQQMLGVDSSQQRKRSLQQLLGRNLVFEQRRRQDADFIFIMATPTMGRSIKPFIDYYYAHDLPVIATSSIFSGKRNPKKDIDLNGIEFPDIPLLLSELPRFQQTREELSDMQPNTLNLFALGFDSYKILSQLSILKSFPEYRWDGLTGELGVDEQGLIHRYLTWAQFNRGIPNVTKEREVKQLTQEKIEAEIKNQTVSTKAQALK